MYQLNMPLDEELNMKKEKKTEL